MKRQLRESTNTRLAHTANPATIARVAYLITLGLIALASFVPQYRVWGLSVWAHLPTWLPPILFIIGVAVLLGEYKLAQSFSAGSREIGWLERIGFHWVAVLTTLVAVTFFLLLRSSTDFLGDGYFVTARLASKHPLGVSLVGSEGIVQVGFKWLFGADNRGTARVIYQLVSWLSGLAFMGIGAWLCGRIFERTSSRIIVFLGLICGGYSLQFFGYVENYAPFLVAVLSFVLIGLLITTRNTSGWWILVPLAIAIILHVLGVVLVVPAVYVIGQRTAAGRRLRNSLRPAWLAAALALSVILAVFVYKYESDFFFRFAFLPLTAGMFTAGEYTLFSPKHLLDLLNLIILTAPGVLLFVAISRIVPWKRLMGEEPFRFLLLCTLSTGLATFLFDPKLGMPRDWDLFSFAAIPFMALGYWITALLSEKNRRYLTVATLAIALGCLSLIPRAVIIHSEPLAVAQFKDYLEVDSYRARSATYLLTEYYNDRGDSAAAEANEAERARRYPVQPLVQQARELVLSGRFDQAKAVTLQALRLDCGYGECWVTLAKIYAAQRQYDSALIAARIADGLSPISFTYRNELAVAYYNTGRPDKAESIWLALVRDSVNAVPLLSLAHLYRAR